MTGHLVPRRHPTPPERSPEERARAAAERAARRGETAPPPETFLARRAAPPEPEPAPAEDPFRVERRAPATGGSWFEPEAAEPSVAPRAEVEAPEQPGPEVYEPDHDERELDMPEDPFGPDEPVAAPQPTQEFRPEWADDDEP